MDPIWDLALSVPTGSVSFADRLDVTHSLTYTMSRCWLPFFVVAALVAGDSVTVDATGEQQAGEVRLVDSERRSQLMQ